MSDSKITNEMLYELFKRSDAENTRRLDDMYELIQRNDVTQTRRLDEMHDLMSEQFRAMREDIRDVKSEIKGEKRAREKLEDKVQKIYDVKDTFTVKFSRSFAGFNALVSAVVAVVVSLFVQK